MKHEAPSTRSAGQITAATINLSKNLIGAGIFTLPSALRDGTVLPGLMVMMMVGAVQASTFILIAFLCQKLDVTTYRGAMVAVFGKRTGNLVDGAILLNCVFGCVSYNILVADFLEKAIHGLLGHYVSRSMLIWATTLLVTLPLSHARNLSPLRVTSVLGLGIIAYVFSYVLSDFLSNIELAAENLQAVAFKPSIHIFSTMALCTGAFQAHYNSPRIFMELGCDLRAHAMTVVCSFGMVFTVYSTFAVSGLGLFGEAVKGNVLKNYPSEGNSYILAAWFGMALSVLCTYPLVFTTGRESLIGMVPALQRFRRANDQQAHVVITTTMICAIATVACLFEDVSFISGMLGATAGAGLCWIFPASIYLKASAEVQEQAGSEPLLGRGRRAAAQIQRMAPLACYAKCVILVGFLSMVVGIAKTCSLI